MADGFWNPDRLNNEGGIAPIFRGSNDNSSSKRYKVYRWFEELNVWRPGLAVLICAQLTYKEGEHGLPDYNTLRTAIGLDSIENWSE